MRVWLTCFFLKGEFPLSICQWFRRMYTSWVFHVIQSVILSREAQMLCTSGRRTRRETMQGRRVNWVQFLLYKMRLLQRLHVTGTNSRTSIQVLPTATAKKFWWRYDNVIKGSREDATDAGLTDMVGFDHLRGAKERWRRNLQVECWSTPPLSSSAEPSTSGARETPRWTGAEFRSPSVFGTRINLWVMSFCVLCIYSLLFSTSITIFTDLWSKST